MRRAAARGKVFQARGCRFRLEPPRRPEYYHSRPGGGIADWPIPGSGQVAEVNEILRERGNALGLPRLVLILQCDV